MRNRPYPWNEQVPWLHGLPEYLAFIEKTYSRQAAFSFEYEKKLKTISYSRFVDDVYRLATVLSSMGWSKKRIAIMGENSYEWILFFFAIILSGAVAIPIDKDLPCEELQERLELVETDVLIYSNSYADVAQDLGCSEKLCFNITESLLRQGREIWEKRNMSRNDFNPTADSMAAIFFTSGTTAKPKGAMLSSQNLIFDARTASRCFWHEGVVLLILPLHHVYGLTASLIAPLLTGSCVSICPSIKKIKRYFSINPPDWTVVVPMVLESIHNEIWRTAEKQKKTKLLKFMLLISNAFQSIGINISKLMFRSVRKKFGGRLDCVLSGGGGLNKEFFSFFRGLGIHIVGGYGITECSPMIAGNRNYHWQDGSLGRPMCDIDIRIAFKNGEVAYVKDSKAFAKVGEIQARGDCVFLGYYNDEQSTREAFTEDGWFKTGDLGYFNSDGFLYISGRIKNLIIGSNGENVSPEWLEKKLYGIPGVAEVLVYQENGKITAEIYPDPNDPGVAEEIPDAVEKINSKLPSYARIARTKLRGEEFPKTASLKIKRSGYGDNIDTH